MDRIKLRWLIWLLVPILVPPLLEWAFMTRFYDIDGHGALIGIFVGVCAILNWPTRRLWRGLAAIAYLPIMGIYMFIEGASLACAYYHSCL